MSEAAFPTLDGQPAPVQQPAQPQQHIPMPNLAATSFPMPSMPMPQPQGNPAQMPTPPVGSIPMPAPPMMPAPQQEQKPAAVDITAADLVKVGDEQAQRQHLGNLIFPHAN